MNLMLINVSTRKLRRCGCPRAICRKHDGDRASRLSQREAMAKRRNGVALDRRRHDGGSQRLPSTESLQAPARSKRLRLQLISPSTSPNDLNTPLTPHSIIHGFAYFNKI